MSDHGSHTQSNQVVQMEVNNRGHPLFFVEITAGDFSAFRRVTVTDPGHDVAALIRRIAKGETDVTLVDRREGEIYERDASGRTFIVGNFQTDESYQLDLSDIEFNICPTANSEVVRLTTHDLEGLQIKLEQLDESVGAADPLPGAGPAGTREAAGGTPVQ